MESEGSGDIMDATGSAAGPLEWQRDQARLQQEALASEALSHFGDDLYAPAAPSKVSRIWYAHGRCRAALGRFAQVAYPTPSRVERIEGEDHILILRFGSPAAFKTLCGRANPHGVALFVSGSRRPIVGAFLARKREWQQQQQQQQQQAGGEGEEEKKMGEAAEHERTKRGEWPLGGGRTGEGNDGARSREEAPSSPPQRRPVVVSVINADNGNDNGEKVQQQQWPPCFPSFSSSPMSDEERQQKRGEESWAKQQQQQQPQLPRITLEALIGMFVLNQWDLLAAYEYFAAALTIAAVGPRNGEGGESQPCRYDPAHAIKMVVENKELLSGLGGGGGGPWALKTKKQPKKPSPMRLEDGDGNKENNPHANGGSNNNNKNSKKGTAGTRQQQQPRKSGGGGGGVMRFKVESSFVHKLVPPTPAKEAS